MLENEPKASIPDYRNGEHVINWDDGSPNLDREPVPIEAQIASIANSLCGASPGCIL
jgi:hypothetical protein